MPPIAAAFTPTLASGDASELLPPLLAPQGWAGCAGPAVGVAEYAALMIHSRGIGGCFVHTDLDLGTVTAFATLSPLPDPTWASHALLPVFEESPGVLSTVERGMVTAIASTDVPFWVQSSTGGDWNPHPWFVPSGTYLTVAQSIVQLPLYCAVHLRDVPVGVAPD